MADAMQGAGSDPNADNSPQDNQPPDNSKAIEDLRRWRTKSNKTASWHRSRVIGYLLASWTKSRPTVTTAGAMRWTT